jgi:hypothetical protein
VTTSRDRSIKLHVFTQRPLLTVGFVFISSILIAFLFKELLPARFKLLQFNDYVGSYEPLARNIMAGRGFIWLDGSVATYQGPGFPAILAALFTTAGLLHLPENTILAAFLLFCNGSISVFVYFLARRLWRPEGAIIVALIWMTYPFYLWFIQQPNSELPYMVLVYGGLLLYSSDSAVSGRKSFLLFFCCGIMWGMAALVRPIGIGLSALGVVILLFLNKRTDIFHRILNSCALLAGMTLMVVPWIMWVYSVNSQFVPIMDSPSYIMYAGMTFALSDDYKYPERFSPDVLLFQQHIRDSYIKSEPFGTILLKEVGEHPLAALKFALIKLSRSWYGTQSGNFEEFALLIQLAYLALSILGSASLWRYKRVRYWIILYGLFICLTWGASTLVVSVLRYMAPMMALLFIFIPGMFILIAPRWFASMFRLTNPELNADSTGSL